METRRRRHNTMRHPDRPWPLILILRQALRWDSGQAAMVGSQSMSSGLRLEGWLVASTAT